MYRHTDVSGAEISLPVGKVVCVGRNYLDHIHELNNEVPDAPLLFIKPNTALVRLEDTIRVPTDKGPCHNELEVAVLICESLTKASTNQAEQAIWGYGLALDLTLREVQSKLKEKGQPWEKAKSFDNSCPQSRFVPAQDIETPQDMAFELKVNGEQRQQGNTAMMMRNTVELIKEISHHFTLVPGDIVLTGTPKGVGPLNPGDFLQVNLEEYLDLRVQVQANHD